MLQLSGMFQVIIFVCMLDTLQRQASRQPVYRDSAAHAASNIALFVRHSATLCWPSDTMVVVWFQTWAPFAAPGSKQTSNAAAGARNALHQFARWYCKFMRLAMT